MYYLIMGPTCAGKDKIARYLVSDYNMKTITSTTSRPIRPGETDGVEYHFLNEEEFLKRLHNGEFIEHRHYDTLVNNEESRWYYGTEIKNVPTDDNDYVAVVSYSGALKYREYFGEENTVFIFITAPHNQRYIRNILRGDYDETEWERRNIDDELWLIEAYNNSDYKIANNGWDYPRSENEHEVFNDPGVSTYVPDFEWTKYELEMAIFDAKLSKKEE